jgi:hypothetical protein
MFESRDAEVLNGLESQRLRRDWLDAAMELPLQRASGRDDLAPRQRSSQARVV